MERSGIYYDTLTNSQGCDSNLVIFVSVNQTTYDTVQKAACNSFTVPSGDETYTMNGVYTDTLKGEGGCDSFITYDLTVNKAQDTIRKNACESYSVPSGDETYLNSGTYTDTINRANACDSLITINLSIKASTRSRLNVTACDSLALPSGENWVKQSGIYRDTITNAKGCDSVITLDVNLNRIDTAVKQSGFVLTAEEKDGAYQWLDCDDGYKPVLGATNRTYVADANGAYAVKLFNGNCSDTSACRNVTTVGKVTPTSAFSIDVYPNPTEGEYRIVFNRKYQQVKVALTDVAGKVIDRDAYEDVAEIRGSIDQAEGIYFLRIKVNDSKVVRRKIIKNH